jgi:hypothetical protein
MKHRKLNAAPVVKLLLFAMCLALVVGGGAFRSGFTQAREERKIKVRTFTRMPLEVKEIRHLQEENWIRDLEIEVKNISRHPIYFISLTLGFPDVPAEPPQPRPDGVIASSSETGFSVYYGALRLLDVMQLAGSDDIPIKPGETYVFKIPEARVLGYESMNRTMNLSPEAWDKIELSFDTISLGDGTGYIGGRRELGSKKKSSDPAQ